MINRTAGVMRLTAAVVCLASLAHVAVLVPRFVRLGQGVSTGGLVLVVGLNVVVFSALGGCLLALILLARSWDRPGARSLAIFLAAAATVWAAIMRLLAGGEIQVEGGFVASGQGSGGGEALLLLFAMMLAAASFLRFSATFPQDLKPGDLRPTSRFPRLRRIRTMLLRPRPVWALGLAMPLVAILVGFLSIILMSAVAPSDTVVVKGVAAVPSLLALLVFPVAAMVIGTQNLLVGYRKGSIEDRKKVLWLVLGVLVSTWMILVPLLSLPLAPAIRWNWPANLAVISWSLAPGVLVSAVAVTMFYTGSVDPVLVLKRGTVLGIIGTAWIIIYAVLESLISQWLSTTLGLAEAVVSAGIAVCAAAVALLVRRVAMPLKVPVSTVGPQPPQ